MGKGNPGGRNQERLLRSTVARDLLRTFLPVLICACLVAIGSNIVQGLHVSLYAPPLLALVVLGTCLVIPRLRHPLTTSYLVILLFSCAIAGLILVYHSARSVGGLMLGAIVLIWCAFFTPRWFAWAYFGLLTTATLYIATLHASGHWAERILPYSWPGSITAIIGYAAVLLTVIPVVRRMESMILEKRASSEALTESRRFSMQVVDHSQRFISWATTDGVMQYANSTALAYVGATLGELEGKLLWETPWFNHDPAEQAKLKNAIQVAASGQPVDYLARHISKEGWVRLFDFRLQPTRDQTGTVTMLVAEGIDVTEQHRAQEALRALSSDYAGLAGREFYEAVSSHIARAFSLDYVFIGELARQRGSVTVLGGYAKGETMGDLSYELADTPCHSVIDGRTCSFPSQVRSLFPCDHLLQQMDIEGYVGAVIKGKRGEPIGIMVALSTSPIEEHEQLNGFLGIFLDRVAVDMERNISDKVLAEEVAKKEKLTEQLHQSQKMDALGQLAGGVAHDFNNSLAGIIGAVELLKIEPSLPKSQEAYLDMIMNAATRAGQLTRRLLTFSRKGVNPNAAVDVAALVTDTTELLRRTIDKSISIGVENRANATMIMGDDSLLQNALMNIGINASHAMPNGGRLTFALDNLTLDDEDCAHSSFPLKPGPYLRVSVQDTGFGMSQETLSHIFEPFFTTKEDGKGTGLGLSAVYGTVKEHHGAITAHSEEGNGSVFHILLPVSACPAQAPARAFRSLSGTGTVLLVDDEELIRKTTSALLESLGYKVILAEDGKKGLAAFHEHRAEIDLVILDMIMPRMSGLDTLKAIREVDNTTPVIISSGFSKSEDLAALKDLDIAGIQHKPFRRHQLAEALSQALRNRKG